MPKSRRRARTSVPKPALIAEIRAAGRLKRSAGAVQRSMLKLADEALTGCVPIALLALLIPTLLTGLTI